MERCTTFVYSHTKCHRSNDNPRNALIELVLRFKPLVAVHSCMVAHGWQTRRPLFVRYRVWALLEGGEGVRW